MTDTLTINSRWLEERELSPQPLTLCENAAGSKGWLSSDTLDDFTGDGPIYDATCTPGVYELRKGMPRSLERMFTIGLSTTDWNLLRICVSNSVATFTDARAIFDQALSYLEDLRPPFFPPEHIQALVQHMVSVQNPTPDPRPEPSTPEV